MAAGAASLALTANPAGAALAGASSVLNLLVGGLLGAHKARAQAATSENAAVAQLIPGVDSSLQQIFSAANSGQISATEAITALQQLDQEYWQTISPFQQKAGTATKSCVAGTPGKACATSGPVCDKTCTAGCCVGCNDISAAIQNCIYVLQSGGGTANICAIFGSKYGMKYRPGYTLTYAPSSSVSSTLNSALSSLGGVLGTSTVTGASGSSSTLLILLVTLGAGVFFLMKK